MICIIVIILLVTLGNCIWTVTRHCATARSTITSSHVAFKIIRWHNLLRQRKTVVWINVIISKSKSVCIYFYAQVKLEFAQYRLYEQHPEVHLSTL